MKREWKLPLYVRVYTGIMENKMETTIICWGLYRDNGKENGNYCSILVVSSNLELKDLRVRIQTSEPRTYAIDPDLLM